MKLRGKRYDKCEMERTISRTRRKRGYANVSETITNYACRLEEVGHFCVFPARHCRHKDEMQELDECEELIGSEE